MTDMQLFAFVVLPFSIGLCAWVAALGFEQRMKGENMGVSTETDLTVEWRTGELRVLARRVKSGPNPFDVKIEKTLQQRWMVVKDGMPVGEWRDVQIVFED